MHSERRSALVTIGLGLLCAGFGMVKALDADVTTGWHAKNEVGRFWMETVKEGPALRDPSIRGQAIESLQELGDPRALPGLIALLGGGAATAR